MESWFHLEGQVTLLFVFRNLYHLRHSSICPLQTWNVRLTSQRELIYDGKPHFIQLSTWILFILYFIFSLKHRVVTEVYKWFQSQSTVFSFYNTESLFAFVHRRIMSKYFCRYIVLLIFKHLQLLIFQNSKICVKMNFRRAKNTYLIEGVIIKNSRIYSDRLGIWWNIIDVFRTRATINDSIGSCSKPVFTWNYQKDVCNK